MNAAKPFVLLAVTAGIHPSLSAEAKAVIPDTDSASFSDTGPTNGAPILYLPGYSGSGRLTEVDLNFTSSIAVVGTLNVKSNKSFTETVSIQGLIEYGVQPAAPSALSSPSSFDPEPYAGND